jgi:uncharacterized membrane protein YphA (DoxX/SURF4 family)
MKDKHPLIYAKHRSRSLPLLSILIVLLITIQLLIASSALAIFNRANSALKELEIHPSTLEQNLSRNTLTSLWDTGIKLNDQSLYQQTAHTFQNIQNDTRTFNFTLQAAGVLAIGAKQKITTSTLTPGSNREQSTQFTNTGDSILMAVGILTSLSAFVTLAVLMFIIFRPIFQNPERRMEHVKIKGKETLIIILNGTRSLIAGLGTWWMNLRTARKNAAPAQPQLAQLPEGIKVIKQNTTRPLVKPCPNCQKNARAHAAFCANCGISLAPPTAMPKSTINLHPYTSEPVSEELPALPVPGELDEEVSEIVHIDLMLKIKLYLLWDKAGR